MREEKIKRFVALVYQANDDVFSKQTGLVYEMDCALHDQMGVKFMGKN